ncbi:MAG: hypothetical protein E4G90_05030 [Gemmatimonadales bacterium]|nr:MAG: hypothetical protein E4G90_05030 [Gemmatimonadales bacterium]
MNTSSGPKRPDKGRVSGKEMANVLADVLKDQNEKAKRRQDLPSDKKRRKTSPVTWVALVGFSIFSAYIWIVSPSWLDPAPPAISSTLADAGLRMEVFQQAVLIEEFLENEGRLPNDLSEAGDPFSAVDYNRIDARAYRLSFAGQGGRVEYVSTEPLDAFLGNSLQVIRQGG